MQWHSRLPSADSAQSVVVIVIRVRVIPRLLAAAADAHARAGQAEHVGNEVELAAALVFQHVPGGEGGPLLGAHSFAGAAHHGAAAHPVAERSAQRGAGGLGVAAGAAGRHVTLWSSAVALISQDGVSARQRGPKAQTDMQT